MYYLLNEELASWRTSFAQFNVSVATMNAHWRICRLNCMDSTQASMQQVWGDPWLELGIGRPDLISTETTFLELSQCLWRCAFIHVCESAREAQWVLEGKPACLRMLANHLHLALPESTVRPPQGFPLFHVLSDRKTCDRTGRELGVGGSRSSS